MSFSQKIFRLNAFLSFSAIATILVVLLLAAVPPVSRDALTHHLYVPKLYLQAGRIIELPDIECSYYPMLLDYIYTIALWFGSDRAPKYIHFLFALLTAYALYGYLIRRLPKEYALFGCTFFLSLPIIVKLSITVYVDLGLIYFTTLALLYIFRWLEQDDLCVQPLLISAVWAGLAVSCKYNGLLILIILTLFVGFLRARYQAFSHEKYLRFNIKPLLFAGLFLITALLVFSPWMIKNQLWTGNPVYPLYDGFFQNLVSTDKNQKIAPQNGNAEDDAEQRIRRQGLNHFQVRKYLYGESGWQILLLPLRVFFQGQDDNPQYFDGRLNPFLLLFAFFAFCKTEKSKTLFNTSLPQNSVSVVYREKWILVFFVIVYFSFAALMSSMRIRYISPIIPAMIILASFGCFNLEQYLGTHFANLKRYRLIVVMMMIIPLGLNADYIADLWGKVQPMEYISGGASRDTYIEKRWPEYSLIRYLNKNIYEARVLGVFLGRRGYYHDHKISFETGHSFLQGKSLNRFAEPENIYSRLREKKYTHILMNIDLFREYVIKKTINPENIDIFFEKYTSVLFSKPGYALFKIEDEGMQHLL